MQLEALAVTPPSVTAGAAENGFEVIPGRLVGWDDPRHRILHADILPQLGHP